MADGSNSSTDQFIFDSGVTRSASRRNRQWILWPLGLSATFVAGCFGYAAWQIRTQELELISLRREIKQLETTRDYSVECAETMKDRNTLREQISKMQGANASATESSKRRETELQELIRFMKEELAAKNALIEDLKNGKAVAIPAEHSQPTEPR